MDTNRLPKQALQYKPKGRRNIGRPRKRWRDQIHLEDQRTGNTPNPSGTWWWCIYLRTNSDLCHLQHELIGFYNRDEKCLQRGTDWFFKQSGLRFVCKGLKNSASLLLHVLFHSQNNSKRKSERVILWTSDKETNSVFFYKTKSSIFCDYAPHDQELSTAAFEMKFKCDKI